MRKRIVMALVLVVLLGLTGCQMVKGAAGDLSWGFDKIDQAIVVPD